MAFKENSDPIKDLGIGVIDLKHFNTLPLIELYRFLTDCSLGKNLNRYSICGKLVIDHEVAEVARLIRWIYDFYSAERSHRIYTTYIAPDNFDCPEPPTDYRKIKETIKKRKENGL